MDKYQNNGQIPKNTKVNLTIFMINLIDIAIVGGLGFVGLKITSVLPYRPLPAIFVVVLFIILGFLLVLKTPMAPKMRNWHVLVNALLMDRNMYFPIKTEGGQHEKEKNN